MNKSLCSFYPFLHGADPSTVNTECQQPRHEMNSTFCVGWWGRIYIRFIRNIKRKFVGNLDPSRWIELKLIIKRKQSKTMNHFAIERMKTNEKEPQWDERKHWNNENKSWEKKIWHDANCEWWNNFNGIYRKVNLKIPAGNSNTMKVYCFMKPNYIEYWLLIGVWCQCFSLFGLYLFPMLDTSDILQNMKFTNSTVLRSNDKDARHSCLSNTLPAHPSFRCDIWKALNVKMHSIF